MAAVTAGTALLSLSLAILNSAPAAAQTVLPPVQSSPAPSDLSNADRPGIADGSGIVGRGVVQIEFGVQREFTEQGGTTTRTSFLPALARIGVGARWEARVESNLYTWTTTIDPAITSHQSGWAPTSFGFKYRAVDAGDGSGPSLAVIGRVAPPSGSGGLESRRVTADMRVVADVNVSRMISLNPNVGLARLEEDGQAFSAALVALTLSVSPSARVLPFVDVALQKPVGIDSGAALIVDAGLAYILQRNVQLDVSIGGDAHGVAPRPFVSVGISWRRQR